MSRGGRLVGERRVQRQFVAERLLFAAVGKPVVNPDLGHQVGAQTRKLGGGHAPLETLGPEGGGGRALERGETTPPLALF